MIHSIKKFSIIFWTLFLVMFSMYSFISGTLEKQDYIQVSGKVTNQVAVAEHYMYNDAIKTKHVNRPEISYSTGEGQLSFVADKRKMATGKTVQILYLKNNPRETRIYNIGFWLNYNVLIPAFLIACFVFCVILISFSRYDEKAAILPGDIDPFVYREPEKLTVD
jgi:hypothetical protein